MDVHTVSGCLPELLSSENGGQGEYSDKERSGVGVYKGMRGSSLDVPSVAGGVADMGGVLPTMIPVWV